MSSRHVKSLGISAARPAQRRGKAAQRRRNQNSLESKLSAPSQGPSKSPPIDLINDALNCLRNNEVKIVKEVKAPSLGGLISGSSTTIIEYPKELVAAFRGMFGALKEYRFEMRFVSPQSTSAGGALLVAISLSPSISSYAEWSALSALFDEVKCMGSSITCASVNAPGSATTAFEMPVTIACDHVNLSTTPASTLAVVRLAGSSTFNTTLCVKPYRKSVAFADSERSWCISGTPYSQAPLGGCIGTWSMANMSVGGGSIQYLSCIIRTYVKLRCRA